MENPQSQLKRNLLYILNLTLSIAGTLVILWFAFGVEQQNSKAQVLFEWMLKRSTVIIAGLAILMVLLLAGSYVAMKRFKDPQKP